MGTVNFLLTGHWMPQICTHYSENTKSLMHGFGARSGRARWLLAVACLACATRGLASEPAKVVVFTGADPVQPAALVQIRAIRNLLQDAAPNGAEVYVETLDGFRFSGSDLAPELLPLVKKKYAQRHIDLVIALGEYGAEFVLKHHEQVWPDAPLLLSSVQASWIRQRHLPPNISIVPYEIDVEKTFSIIESVQPDAHRIVVIGGVADADRPLIQRVAAAARNRQHQWSVIESWEGVPLRELQRRLATLDKNTAVFYTTAYLDRDGHHYFPYQLVSPMVEASRAPIYSWVSVYVDYGLTAGAVYDLEENGRKTAELAAGLLPGSNKPIAATQPSLPLLPSRCVVNLSQFERMGLPVSRIPPDCRLVNPPPSIFREYRGTILSLSGVLLAQSVTIAALLAQRRRRRRAEAEATSRRAELARAVRFATVGELSASIAHEVGQPLGAILSNADAAELLVQSSRASIDDLQEILSDVKRDALRANDVVVRLRALLEKQSVSFRLMQVDEAIQQALSLIEPEARKRQVLVEEHLDGGGFQIMGDPVQIQQILLNLALNAMDAMAGTVTERRVLSIATAQRDKVLVLQVADRGCGFESGSMQRIFDPFFTTKPHGMGLGLSIVRTIVEAHRGTVHADPREGGGTIFKVSLPASTAFK